MTGYKVEMMNSATTNGRFITVFDDKMNCLNDCSFLIRDVNLIRPGESYRFKITGRYQNGYTETSSESEDIFTCGPPSLLSPPTLVSVSVSDITLKWNYPQQFNHCRVTGFALFMNDGQGGDVYTEIDAA